MSAGDPDGRGAPHWPQQDRHEGGRHLASVPHSSGSPTWRPSPQPSPSPRGRGPGLVRSALLPIGVFLLVLAVGLSGYAGWRALVQPPPAPPPAAAGSELSRPAPPGWSSQFAWSQEISETRDIAVSNNRIATINANGSLVVLNADGGEVMWASKPVVISTSARPVIADAGGTPVAGIIDGQDLYLSRLDDASGSPELSARVLPPQSAVTWTGGSLLVTAPSGTWTVGPDLNLRSVDVPRDEVAMAADAEQVISAPQEGGWLLTGGDDQERVTPDVPRGARGSPHPAWAARGVVFAWWDTSDGRRKVASLHDARSGELLALSQVSDDTLRGGMFLTVSPGRALASAGPMLVDLRTGFTTIDDEWNSQAAPNDRYLYGSRSGIKAVWDGREVTDMDPDAAVPWGTSDAGLAIVLDRTEEGTTLVGGLRPE